MIKGTNWYDYDEGYSIGTSGPDGGLIVRDEEHQSGARMTLEEDGSFAPFSITCGIYGWMFHTRYFSEESQAAEEFELMKTDLDEILESFSTGDDADEDALDEISVEISEFVEKYP
jgi:hypothetical protein